MAAGGGGSRPYAPKESDEDDLNTEKLFNEYMNLQRRKKWLKDVRLELISEPSEGGEAAHFDPWSKDVPTIKMFLPNLRRGWQYTVSEPRAKGHPYKHRDFTKYVASVMRHEAAHAHQRQQNLIRGVGEFDDPAQKKPPKGRMAYIDVPQHGVIFNILNRLLAGAGAEQLLPQIGLPDEVARARWQQGLRTTGPGASMNLPVWGGRG